MDILKDLHVKLVEFKKIKDFNSCIKVCREGIRLASRDQYYWYGFRINLALSLIDYREDISSNIEEAIQLCQQILENISQDKRPKEVAFTNMTLGYAYSYRIQGNKDNNLFESIRFYERALDFYNKNLYSHDWASIKAAIGLSYAEMVCKTKKDIELAMRNYQDALEVFEQSGFVEDCEDINKALRVLKNVPREEKGTAPQKKKKGDTHLIQ